MDAVLRQQQQFVDEQRLQNKQIELKKAELQELEGEILKQKKEIQKRLEVAANSAKKLLQVPEAQPEPSSSTSKHPANSKPTSRLPSLSSQQRKKRRQHFFLHYLINKTFLRSISNFQILSNRYPWIHLQCTPYNHRLVVPIPMSTCISALHSSRTSLLGPIGRCK